MTMTGHTNTHHSHGVWDRDPEHFHNKNSTGQSNYKAQKSSNISQKLQLNGVN